ncbi:YpiB family protein [Salsuginibacillus kocurii]|uniref:YpiB family protein n=1 Tax=Salsuginibacillus kocurii TaxID=427078 RepID=UPI00037D9F4E|nr:YpiB family protein [Salsuginibacillus kocurii]
MEELITTSEKRAFIHDFLDTVTLKEQQTTWLLQYIASDEELLSHIHFVEETANCPRALMISTNGVNDASFRYKRNTVVTYDPEHFLHDVARRKTEPLYIQLQLPKDKCPNRYRSVLEQNPFSEKTKTRKNYYSQEATSLIAYLEEEHEIAQLKQEIDQALDERDQAQFEQLREKLGHLENKRMEQ